MSIWAKVNQSPRVRRTSHTVITADGYPSSRYVVVLHDGWLFAGGSNTREFRYVGDALAAVQAATPVIPS